MTAEQKKNEAFVSFWRRMIGIMLIVWAVRSGMEAYNSGLPSDWFACALFAAAYVIYYWNVECVEE